MSDSLQSHELQHARLPCPSPTPRACSSSCSWSQWCHPTISSSVVPFSSCLQSFPASGSFPVRQFFASDGQSIGASASAWVLPTNIQDWFPLGLTGLISLSSNGLSKEFSPHHSSKVSILQFKGINFPIWCYYRDHSTVLKVLSLISFSLFLDPPSGPFWYMLTAHSSALCCPHAEQHHK